jgi:hypothetical protein
MVIILFGHLGNAQSPGYINFVKSFREEDAKDILQFSEVVQSTDMPMTKEEALRFVYSGDTSKLYCQQKIFNMETEVVSGISTELYLPIKSLKMSMGNYTLIAFSEYSCENPDELLKVILTLVLVDNTYQVRDTMVAYLGSDYDIETTGLFNPVKANVLIVNTNQTSVGIEAFVYHINEKTLKFEVIKENLDVNGTSDNLVDLVERLGWEGFF